MKTKFTPTPSYYRLAAYFFPLALQVTLQTLSYPIVAILASRAPGGALNTAGLVQASAIVGLLWALGNGMHTGGLIYARTREGYRQFTQVNYWITAGMATVYMILILPPVSNFIFSVMMQLPPSIATPAKRALIFSFPMTLLFFQRTPYFVLMYVRGTTYVTFITAAVRMFLIVLLTTVLLFFHATGIFWAVFCMFIAIAAESLFLRVFAKRGERHLPPQSPQAILPRRREILAFVLTLSIGAALLSFSGFMIGAFIARAANPERMLPVYYLVAAVVSSFSGGIIRIQTLTIAYYRVSALVNRRLLIFAVCAGIFLGMLHLILLHPNLLNWYYSGLQGLNSSDFPLVKITSWFMVLFAPSVALRAYAEGIAAYHKKPIVVLTGQAIYLAMVAVCAFFALNIGISGNLIGPMALFTANILGASTIFMAMRWEQRPYVPVPDTLLSQNTN